MAYILVFTKKTKEYKGLARAYQGKLFLSEYIGTDKSERAAIETILSKVHPAQIIGHAAHHTDGTDIKDTIRLVTEKDSAFYPKAAAELTTYSDIYYFIHVEEPISWNVIEEEIVETLQSGIVTKPEQEHIVSEMPRMNKQQLLLLRYLLKQLGFRD
jgi:hypothetical protein